MFPGTLSALQITKPTLSPLGVLPLKSQFRDRLDLVYDHGIPIAFADLA